MSPELEQEGMLVELEGTVDPNSSASIEARTSVTVLGRSRMPEPLRHSWNTLMTGEDDDRWVEVEGVVREMEGHRLVLEVAGGMLVVWINEIDKGACHRLLGSVIRASGVCSPVANDRNQRLGVRLLVPSMENVDLVSALPDDPFTLPVSPIGDVIRADSGAPNPGTGLQKTTGIVTYAEPRTLFIQDGEEGLRVLLQDDAQVTVGDEVEVVGRPEADGFSPKLVLAHVRKIGHQKMPDATPIDLASPDLSAHDAARGWIEATFIGMTSRDGMDILELQELQRSKTFHALRTAAKREIPDVPVGSRVRLERVFKASADEVPDIGEVMTSFQM